MVSYRADSTVFFKTNFKPLLEYTPKQCSPATLTASLLWKVFWEWTTCVIIVTRFNPHKQATAAQLFTVCVGGRLVGGGSDFNLSCALKDTTPTCRAKADEWVNLCDTDKKNVQNVLKSICSRCCQKSAPYAVSHLQRVSQIFCYMPLLRPERRYDFHLWFWNLHTKLSTYAQKL